MSFSVGIIGLPNVGKSTLFKALTKKQVDIADYPFTTIHPNVGVVAVPDKRLEKIAEIIKPEKVTPTVIDFVDIAGLVKNAHKGEGLGNQFLAQIRNCDALVQVVKCFGSQINQEQEIETIKTELEMKDLECKEKENLLSKKSVIYLFNTSNNGHQIPEQKGLSLNLKLEEEISELFEEEKKELEVESKLDQLISACYNILDLITFYTITGGKEVRAWTIKRNTKCPIAAGKVHSDFEEKFIRAEVINCQELISVKSWQKVRELGLIRTVGKDYIVQDSDIIEFRI
jgi:small GTP-binding protein